MRLSPNRKHIIFQAMQKYFHSPYKLGSCCNSIKSSISVYSVYFLVFAKCVCVYFFSGEPIIVFGYMGKFFVMESQTCSKCLINCIFFSRRNNSIFSELYFSQCLLLMPYRFVVVVIPVQCVCVCVRMFVKKMSKIFGAEWKPFIIKKPKMLLKTHQ